MSRSWKTNRPGGLALTRAALEICRFGPADLVLDAGCGFGATAGYLNQQEGLAAIGLDADLSRLTAVRDQLLPRTAARLPELPFRPESFHGIFCECVLSLVPDKDGCLEGFYRAMVPGGKLVLTDLVLPRPAGELSGEGRAAGSPATCLDGALTRADLAAAVEGAGFSITRMEDHTRLLKEMACEMVFEYGSLDRFWQELTRTDFHSGLAGRCRAGLHPGYVMIIAEKPMPAETGII